MTTYEKTLAAIALHPPTMKVGLCLAAFADGIGNSIQITPKAKLFEDAESKQDRIRLLAVQVVEVIEQWQKQIGVTIDGFTVPSTLDDLAMGDALADVLDAPYVDPDNDVLAGHISRAAIWMALGNEREALGEIQSMPLQEKCECRTCKMTREHTPESPNIEMQTDEPWDVAGDPLPSGTPEVLLGLAAIIALCGTVAYLGKALIEATV